MKAGVERFDLLNTPLTPGVTLVEASAGTGKTFAIAGLFLRYVLEAQILAENILVVTFTRAATAELRHRIRAQLALARRWVTGRGEPPGKAEPLLQELLKRSPGDVTYQRRCLNLALENFDQAPIYTIDSFCQRVLQECAFATGTLFESEFVTDVQQELSGVIDDFWRARFYGPGSERRAALADAAELNPAGLERIASQFLAHPCLRILPALAPNPQAAREAIEAAATPDRLGEVAAAWATALKAELLDSLRTELTRALDHRRSLTFADLRQRLEATLARPGAEGLIARVRHRFRVALIDEFQDTDPIQFELFRRFFGSGAGDQHLYLVGDPKQAIYSFRGADVFAYLAARGRPGTPARILTLSENWRSEAPLVEAVNALFGRDEGDAPAFVLPEITFQPVIPRGKAELEPLREAGGRRPSLQLWYWRPGPEQVRRAAQQERVAQAVAQEIERLLSEATFATSETSDGPARPLRREDIAVLVSSHTEAEVIESALRQRNLPCVRQTRDRIFDTAEAIQLLRLMQAVADPGNDRALRAAAASPLLGWTAAELAAIESESGPWIGLAQRFRRYAAVWERRGFLAAWEELSSQEALPQRWLGLIDGERRYTNLLHLAELLEGVATARHLGLQALADWLERQIANPGAREEDEALLRLERDDEAVRLVTIHSSKGLEYPVVFCPFLFESGVRRHSKQDLLCYHDPSATRALTADLRTPDEIAGAKQLAQGETFAERVRLAYVAITRAKHRCYVVWGPITRSPQAGSCFETSPLGWILHPPPGGPPELGQVTEILKAHLKPDKKPRDLTPDLERLCQRVPAGIELRELPETAPKAPPERGGQEDVPLEARSFRRPIERDWGVTSYSALTGQIHALPEVAAFGEPVNEPEAEPSRETDAFRGIQAGNCLHAIFERYPRLGHDRPALTALVRQQLIAHGFAPDPLAPAVLEMVERTLAVPLELAGTKRSLRQIPVAAWHSEVPFHLPLRRVTPRLLAELAREHGRGRAGGWDAWPSALEALDFDSVRGYLTGKIDLLFAHDGRYYLVDWKSNRLAATSSGYTPARVFTEMLAAQYLLQYHLYLLALHRQLRQRRADYRYETHFGGVFYLFVRGLDPRQPEWGVFHDCPPAPFIEALAERLLAPATGGAA